MFRLCTVFDTAKKSVGMSQTRLCRWASNTQDGVMNVFDRKAKRQQRNRSALNKDYQVYEYLKEEVCSFCHAVCDFQRAFVKFAHC